VGGLPTDPVIPFGILRGRLGNPPYEIIYFPLSKENPECGINYLVGGLPTDLVIPFGILRGRLTHPPYPSNRVPINLGGVHEKGGSFSQISRKSRMWN